MEIWFRYEDVPPKIIILPFIVAEQEKQDPVSKPKVKSSITVSVSENIQSELKTENRSSYLKHPTELVFHHYSCKQLKQLDFYSPVDHNPNSCHKTCTDIHLQVKQLTYSYKFSRLSSQYVSYLDNDPSKDNHSFQLRRCEHNHQYNQNRFHNRCHIEDNFPRLYSCTKINDIKNDRKSSKEI